MGQMSRGRDSLSAKQNGLGGAPPQGLHAELEKLLGMPGLTVPGRRGRLCIDYGDALTWRAEGLRKTEPPSGSGAREARPLHAHRIELPVNHRLERPEQPIEAVQLRLEHPERLNDGLHGRDTHRAGLLPYSIPAGGTGCERHSGQRSQRSVVAQQGPSLMPCAINHHELRWRASERETLDGGRAVSRVEQHRVAR